MAWNRKARAFEWVRAGKKLYEKTFISPSLYTIYLPASNSEKQRKNNFYTLQPTVCCKPAGNRNRNERKKSWLNFKYLLTEKKNRQRNRAKTIYIAPWGCGNHCEKLANVPTTREAGKNVLTFVKASRHGHLLLGPMRHFKLTSSWL